MSTKQIMAGRYRVVAAEPIANRVWLAYHSLPRDAKGRPPSRRQVEIENDLPRSILSKLFTDERQTVEAVTVMKLSRALAVTADWLLSGAGEPPQPTGPVPPRKLDTWSPSDERPVDEQSWPDATRALAMRAFQIAIVVTHMADAIGKDARTLLRDPISSLIKLGGDLDRLSNAIGKHPADVDRVPESVDDLSAEDIEAVYEDLVQLVEAKRDEARRRADRG
ncbi:MAG: hypothetical protein ABJE95_00915 [Byssovorax sp.]